MDTIELAMLWFSIFSTELASVLIDELAQLAKSNPQLLYVQDQRWAAPTFRISQTLFQDLRFRFSGNAVYHFARNELPIIAMSDVHVAYLKKVAVGNLNIQQMKLERDTAFEQ